MAKPTDAQNEQFNEWVGTRNLNYYEGIEALGYLLQYAVSKVDFVYIETRRPRTEDLSYVEYHVYAANWNRSKKTTQDKDLATALFWACFEVLKNEDK